MGWKELNVWKFNVMGRSQLLLATGDKLWIVECGLLIEKAETRWTIRNQQSEIRNDSLANRRQETAPTVACFKPPKV